MATTKSTRAAKAQSAPVLAAPAGAPLYRLTLVSWPPDRKVAVLKALQTATKGSNELTLDGAKGLIEGALPAAVDYYDTERARDEARKVLEAAGAVVIAERVADINATLDPQRPELAALDAYEALPFRLRDHLEDKRDQAHELLSFLERLDADDDMPICMRIAVRMAEELADALDALTVGRVLTATEEAQS